MSTELVNTMNEPFLQFEWPVAPAYEWRDWLDSNGQPVVVPAEGLASFQSCSGVELASKRLGETGPVLCPTGDPGASRRYRPMQREHAALFRTFAALDYRDPAAIRAFANKYGRLGLEPQRQLIEGSMERPDHYVEGESHLAWAREICRMKEALRLAHRQTPSDSERRKLSRLFDVNLQWVQGRMIFDPDKPPRFSVAPLSLLTAMWLQLALAIAGDKQFVECKHCHRLMEISTEETGFRTHREFCSDSCKTKDYRKRKRTALELAARGASVSTIADRAATNGRTVRRWVAAFEKKRQSAAKGDK
jgi:hypothetical protein